MLVEKIQNKEMYYHNHHYHHHSRIDVKLTVAWGPLLYEIGMEPFTNNFTEFSFKHLTHCGQVTPYGNVDLGQHWLR